MKGTIGKKMLAGAGVLLFGGTLLFYTANDSAVADKENSSGAKLHKVSEKPFALSEDKAEQKLEEVAVEETAAVRLIEIEHGERVTKEDLMKHKWTPVIEPLEEPDDPEENKGPWVNEDTTVYLTIHTFTENSRQLETVNSETGEILSEEVGKTDNSYTYDGDIFHEEFYLTSQTLEAAYQLSWQGSRVVFRPYDEYDHKEERTIVLQPVGIVE